MHIRTYVNCFGNIVLQMSSVHCGVSGETADKARLALWKFCAECHSYRSKEHFSFQ